MLKVLIADELPPEAAEILASEPGIECLTRTGLKGDELKAAVADVDGIIVRSATKLTSDVLAAAKKLKAIARAGVGVDNVDVDAASKHGVVVMNTPGGNTISAAEQTLALMLALSRNIPQAHASLKEKKWERSKFMGTQLDGKTLGVIGLGRIGADVAKKACAFNMRVIGLDPYVTAEKAAELHVELVGNLDALLTQADYITVHVPRTAETKAMIADAEFAKMKTGVRLINCARGGIIDEDALHRAITSGKVAGAALDVFVEEPPTDWKLVELPQVVCTPHLGASTEEAQLTVAKDAAKQLADALLGRGVRYAVNLPPMDPHVLEELQPFCTLAQKIGSLKMQLLGGQIGRVQVSYLGEIAKLDTSVVTRYLLAGLLSPILEETVNMVNAPLLAAERGLVVREVKSTRVHDYGSLVLLEVKTDGAERSVGGTIFGKAEPRIVLLDGYRVEANPEGRLLVVFADDRPGLIGSLGQILGTEGVNIASMTFGRKAVGGDAIMILNLDGNVSAAVLARIRQARHVRRAQLVEL